METITFLEWTKVEMTEAEQINFLWHLYTPPPITAVCPCEGNRFNLLVAN